MIEIANLSRCYGTHTALAGVTLSVEPVRLVAVVGPNGSGKTTLFSLIAGLIGPTAGTIRLWGDDSLPRPATVLRRMALMLDRHFPGGSVRVQDLLSLKAAAAPTFDAAWCRELLAELPGVTPARRFGQLSKGQRQWVLAAVSLAARADLLVLDEPADGLDTAARRRLLQLLRSAVDERGATVLVASHVLTDLERVADTLVVLQQGAIRLHADLEELRSEVREVEFSEGLPDLDELVGARVLATRSISDRVLAWIRLPDWDLAPEHWPGERRRRTVGLEELYLALTQKDHTPPCTAGQSAQPVEMKTCP